MRTQKNVLFVVLLLMVMDFMLVPSAEAFTFPKDKSSGEFQRELEADLKKTMQAIDLLKEQLTKKESRTTRSDLLMQLAELFVEKARFHYFLAREKNGESVKGPVDVAEAVIAKEEAIVIYQDILRQFPNYFNNDKAIFFMAQEYGQLGQDKEERRQYDKLIRHYPKSEFRDDALLMLGNKEFDAKNISEAAKYYERILREPEGSLHNVARYKLAWCDINRDQCGRALHLFEQIAKSETATEVMSGKSNLRREALVDSILCYTKVKKAHQAIAYYKTLSDSNNTYVAVLDKLANRYYIQKEIKESAPLYRELIRRSNDLERTIEYLQRLFGNLRQVGYDGPIDEDAEILVTTLRRYYYSWRYPDDEKKTVVKQMEQYLRDAATRLQLTAQRSRDPQQFKMAAKTYKFYLQAFAKSKNGPKMRVNAAEAHFDAGDYLKAAEMYLELAETSTNRQHIVSWLHSSIAAYLEALKNKDKLTKLELIQARSGFIKGSERFLQYAPNSPRAPDIQFTIAQLYYDDNDWSRSIEQFTQFLSRYPNHSKSPDAGRLLLDSYNMNDDIDGMVNIGKRILQSGRIKDGQFLREVREVVSKAEFKTLETSLDPTGDSGSTASEFFRLSMEYKGTEAGEKALYNLFVVGKSQGQPSQMMSAAEQLRKDYPRSKYLEEVLPILSQSMIQAGIFEDGVSRAEQFVGQFPRSELAGDLLFQAGKIRAGLRQFRPAYRNFEQASRLSGKTPKTVILQAYCDAAQEAQNWSELERAAKLLRAADPSHPRALGFLAKAMMKQGQYGPGQAIANQASARAAQIGNAAERAEFLAELALLAIEPVYRQYQQLAITQRGQSEDKVVEQKGRLLESLEKQYTEVANMGSGRWTIAALARVGHAYQNFAQFLTQTSLPSGLGAAQVAQYKQLMTAKINQMRMTSQGLYRTCRDRAFALKLYTHDAMECAMEKHLPETVVPEAKGGINRGEMEALVRRLVKNADDVAALVSMARLYLQQAKYSAAILVLSRASAINARQPEIHHLIGVAFHRMGQFYDAYQNYALALKVTPNLTATHANIIKLCELFKDARCVSESSSRVNSADLSRVPPTDLVQ